MFFYEQITTMQRAMTTMILAALLALSAAPSLACEKPLIVGSVVNQSGGKIMFLTSFDNCPKSTQGSDVLGVSGDGQAINGCWLAEQDVVMVEWNDDTSYVYPMTAVDFTKEWMAFSECEHDLKEKRR